MRINPTELAEMLNEIDTAIRLLGWKPTTVYILREGAERTGYEDNNGTRWALYNTVKDNDRFARTDEYPSDEYTLREFHRLIMSRAFLRSQSSRDYSKNPSRGKNMKKKNPARRRNVSDQRKELRNKYRAKHGNDWWKKDSIKDKFEAELKKTPKGSFTRDGMAIAELADQTDSELIKELARQSKGKKSRGRGKKKQVATKAKTDKFVNYVHSFYGPGKVSSINATKKEVRDAVKAYFDAFSNTRSKYKELVPRGGFDGDSIDRENVFIILMDITGREPTHSKKTRGRGKKTTKKKSSSRSFSGQSSYMDKVDIAIEKHFSPVVKKGVSEMQMIDSDIYQWSVGDEGMLELVLIKDSIAIVLDLDNNKIVEVAIKKKDMTPTQLAKQIAAYYKELTGKSSSKKSSSRKSSSKHIGNVIKVVGFPSKESGGKEMSESMFVEVISGTVNNGTGKLMNDPVSSDLRYGDIVEFGGGNAKLHPKFKKATSKTKPKSSSRKSSAKSRAKGSRKQKAEFKIRKSGKSFKWELVIGGDIAQRAGYKSRATAKKGLLGAIAKHEKLIENRGVDTFKLYCDVRDSK